MTQQQVQKTATVTIGPLTKDMGEQLRTDKLDRAIKPTLIDGRDGKQWQIDCITAPSMFPERKWLNLSTHPDEPEVGVHTSLLTRGGLKKAGRDGIPKTGASEFDWNWRIEQLDYNGPPIYAPPSGGGGGGGGGAPTSPPGTGGSFNYSDPKQASIERQVAMYIARDIRIAALRMATDLVVAGHLDIKLLQEQANDNVEHIISGTGDGGGITEWTEFLADALANRVPVPPPEAPPEEAPIFEPEPEPVTDSCPHCGDPAPSYTTLPDQTVRHVISDGEGRQTWCPAN
jgi:hypothetical protein